MASKSSLEQSNPLRDRITYPHCNALLHIITAIIVQRDTVCIPVGL